jgi:DNA adenine methylase
MNLPHAIPYQGSKRKLAPMIGPYIPDDIDTFFEPFCGSGAMTIYAAHYRLANKFVLGDTLEPIVSLLREIVENPSATSARYRELWNGQEEGDPEYFNRIRERYNTDRDPVELLYLICRCVKNETQPAMQHGMILSTWTHHTWEHLSDGISDTINS